jgi:hypothetical protein
MAFTNERLENIIWSLIRAFSPMRAEKSGRKWLDTPFAQSLPNAQRRASFFRRLRTEIPAVKASVAELATEPSLTPRKLLRRLTGEIEFLGTGSVQKKAAAATKAPGPLRAAPKKAAAKKKPHPRRLHGGKRRGRSRGRGSPAAEERRYVIRRNENPPTPPSEFSTPRTANHSLHLEESNMVLSARSAGNYRMERVSSVSRGSIEQANLSPRLCFGWNFARTQIGTLHC